LGFEEGVGVGRGRGRGGEEKYSLIRDAAGRTCGDSKVTKDNRKQQKVSIIMMAIFWLLFFPLAWLELNAAYTQLNNI